MVAYIAPMATFMLLTQMEGTLPRHWYPFFYCLKILAVSGSLVACRSTFVDVRPVRDVVLLSVITGLAVCVLWVAVDKLIPYPHLGTRMAFDPFAAIQAPVGRAIFIAARLYGLVLMVPLMEELFWRSFLLRYLTNVEFHSVPLGAFSWSAFCTVAALFAVAHPEWLSAALTACVYGLLLRRTRSLFAAVVAHAVTNAALGGYVLLTRDWLYW